MENIKFKLELLSREYDNELTIKNMFKHMIKFGYIMLQLKKKFKNKRQVLATKKWCLNNKEKYNEMKKGVSKRYYDSHQEYRESKSKSYFYKKECKRLQCILL